MIQSVTFASTGFNPASVHFIETALAAELADLAFPHNLNAGLAHSSPFPGRNQVHPIPGNVLICLLLLLSHIFPYVKGSHGLEITLHDSSWSKRIVSGVGDILPIKSRPMGRVKLVSVGDTNLQPNRYEVIGSSLKRGCVFHLYFADFLSFSRQDKATVYRYGFGKAFVADRNVLCILQKCQWQAQDDRIDRINANGRTVTAIFYRIQNSPFNPSSVKSQGFRDPNWSYYSDPRTIRNQESFTCRFNFPTGGCRSLLSSIGGIFRGFGLPLDYFERADGDDNADDASKRQKNGSNQRDSVSCGTWWITHDPYGPLIWRGSDCAALLIGGIGGGPFFCYGRRRWLGWLCIGLGLGLCGIGTFLVGWGWAWGTCKTQDKECRSHGGNTVTQKYLLTIPNYCNTVIAIGRTNMANVLSMEKQVAVISALAEGSGIRQIERPSRGASRFTIGRSASGNRSGVQTW